VDGAFVLSGRSIVESGGNVPTTVAVVLAAGLIGCATAAVGQPKHETPVTIAAVTMMVTACQAFISCGRGPRGGLAIFFNNETSVHGKNPNRVINKTDK